LRLFLNQRLIAVSERRSYQLGKSSKRRDLRQAASVGGINHVAWRVDDEEHQREIRERIEAALPPLELRTMAAKP
jgi:hypothetical protein